MINNHKAPNDIVINDDFSREWKIQFTMRIDFISSLDTREICTMDTESDNVEIMMGIKTDDIIKELLKSSKERYQEG